MIGGPDLRSTKGGFRPSLLFCNNVKTRGVCNSETNPSHDHIIHESDCKTLSPVSMASASAVPLNIQIPFSEQSYKLPQIPPLGFSYSANFTAKAELRDYGSWPARVSFQEPWTWST